MVSHIIIIEETKKSVIKGRIAVTTQRDLSLRRCFLDIVIQEAKKVGFSRKDLTRKEIKTKKQKEKENAMEEKSQGG